jgi:hypothetical protein
MDKKLIRIINYLLEDISKARKELKELQEKLNQAEKAQKNPEKEYKNSWVRGLFVKR